jgi:hypothetical protein
LFELLNSNDQKLTLDDVVEIRKQTALEEAEKTEPKPKESAMTVSC